MGRRARSALFVLIAAKSHLINYSWVKRQKVAKFFTFFRFCWHLEDGKDTILFRISRRTIPLKISKSENQGKWPKIASEGAHPSQGELARIYGQPGNNCTHANIYTTWISQGFRLTIPLPPHSTSGEIKSWQIENRGHIWVYNDHRIKQQCIHCEGECK